MTLLFNEEAHKYQYLEMPDFELVSASGIISLYHEPFDVEKHAGRIAEKRGVSIEEIKKEWKDKNTMSLEKGKKYHSFMEEKAYNSGKIKGLPVIKHEEEGGFKKAFDILNLKPGVYPELMVDLPRYGIVGTADYVEIYEDNTFILEDYKTNAKLDLEGFPVWNPTTKKKEPKMMYAPISKIHDCNFGHYTVQLSLYAYALEEAGYTLRKGGLTIHHVLFDGDNPVDTVSYPVNYIKKEIKALLEHFKKNREKQLKTLKEIKSKK